VYESSHVNSIAMPVSFMWYIMYGIAMHTNSSATVTVDFSVWRIPIRKSC